MLNINKFIGVQITNETSDSILKYLLQKIAKNDKFFIVTPNPEILVYAHRHENFKKILNSAEISLPDGTGLFLASVLLGKPFKERIPGVDFIDFICKNTVSKPISMGFLGGKGGVAEITAKRLLAKYPHLDIRFVSNEWGEEGFGFVSRSKISVLQAQDKQDQKSKIEVKSQIEPRKKIDLLFVAFGHPKQEEWIYRNLDHIPVTAAMGVGGAFDYISGQVSRAPLFVRAIGFEWLYRLIRQPWRWKRQLALIEFAKLIFTERLSKS